jgi:PAS domain-containing protein
MKAEREDGLDVLGRDRHHGCSQVASSLLEAAVAASDGIALTDADGRFTFMNASHASLFGYDKPADLLRQS